jgi:transposase
VQVERAFRAFNTDLDIRPIRHRTEDRVRAHVFLRMLSYYLRWHMQTRRTENDLRVHSFSTLFAELSTICLNQIQATDPAQPPSGSSPPPPRCRFGLTA